MYATFLQLSCEADEARFHPEGLPACDRVSIDHQLRGWWVGCALLFGVDITYVRLWLSGCSSDTSPGKGAGLAKDDDASVTSDVTFDEVLRHWSA